MVPSKVHGGAPCAFRLLFASLAATLVIGNAPAVGASLQAVPGVAEADDSETVVDIPDAALRRALEDALEKGSGEPITRADMEGLHRLLGAYGVGRLDGIEHAVNLLLLGVEDGDISDVSALASLESLTYLSLGSNAITDVSALGSLESLTVLGLNGNAITDVSALGSLESLTALNLYGNAITDVSALGSLESLTELSLYGNAITDVSALGSLESLTELWLGSNAITDVSALGSLESLTVLGLNGNAITDVSALGSLESLTGLWLGSNAITDVAPLVQNEGLGDGDHVDLRENPLNVQSIETHIPKLQQRGVHVQFDAIPIVAIPIVVEDAALRGALEDALGKGSGEPITRADMEGLHSLEAFLVRRLDGIEHAVNLVSLRVAHGYISDVSALASLESLTELSLNGNAITDVAPLLRNAGLGDGDWVDLRGNLLSIESIETHIPVLLQRGVEVFFDPIPSLPDGAVVAEIADLAIRGILEAVLGKGAGWPITADELAEVEGLEVSNRNVETVSGLELATGLTYLDLRGNAIADLRPVADMALLNFLHLDGNHIEDIAPLARLPLRVLSLSDNMVKDLGSLAGMDGLYWLALDGNSIRDLPVFPRGLSYLYLTDNSISDITALANLPLTELRLSGNSIASLTSLAGMSLSYLHINDNQVTDLTPLNFDSLVELHIRNNAVQDLSPLLRGDRLAMVDVRGNPLSREAMGVLGTLRESGVTVLAGEAVPYFPAAGTPGRVGFVRIVNRSNADGDVFVEAVDDAGVRVGPVRIRVGARGAVHFNSGDLENGNAAKGLRAGVGRPTAGDWRLEVISPLDIEVLSYVRTDDGFVTAMHDVATQAMLPFFNPGSNENQESILRVVNTEAERARWMTGGHDDSGEWYPMAGAIEVRPGHALRLTAKALEDDHGLGDRDGKWRLRARGFPWFAMSLLDSTLLDGTAGPLANLSTAPNHAESLADGRSMRRVPLFLTAGEFGEGFLRVINRSAVRGEVAIEAVDDEGSRFGPVRLTIGARRTAHFKSGDLETGNTDKGLSGGIGVGEGDWRLELASELDLLVLSYVRKDGFLTNTHDLAPLAADGSHRVVFFNPGSNENQVSRLRLINNGDEAASVTITGIDDAGSDSGTVTLTVPAASALDFTSEELEKGEGPLAGGLGDGSGKWRLRVNSDVPLGVMSLLENRRTGHLANVSTGTED